MSTPKVKNIKKFFPIGERLLELVDKQPESLTEISRRMGMSKQALNAVRNTANPGIDTLLRLSDSIGMSPNDILKPFLSFSIEAETSVNEPDMMYGYAAIPVLNAMAAAGIPLEVDLTSAERYPVMRIHASVLRPSSGYVALQVTGLSMQPILNDGDWVVIARVHDMGELREGNLYVVVTESGAAVKILESRMPDTLHFRSANADFGPFQPLLKDIIQLWEVRMKFNHV